MSNNKTYALLGPDKKAVNFIAWDGVAPIEVEEGHSVVLVPSGGNYGYGWMWDGDKFIDPNPPAPVVPEKITQVQLRLTLSIYGLLPIVEQKVSALSEVERIYWQYATEVRRANPILNRMAAELNLTPEQVDEMFIFAAGL